MAVSSPHILGLMAHESINNLLANTSFRQIAGERMSECVETLHNIPLALRERLLKVVNRLLPCQRLHCAPISS